VPPSSLLLSSSYLSSSQQQDADGDNTNEAHISVQSSLHQTLCSPFSSKMKIAARSNSFAAMVPLEGTLNASPTDSMILFRHHQLRLMSGRRMVRLTHLHHIARKQDMASWGTALNNETKTHAEAQSQA